MIPAGAIAAIEDPDIREVLEELLADSIVHERRPDPWEIPGLVRDCVDEIKVLPGVELFGDRREALHAALKQLIRSWFFGRQSLVRTVARAGSRASAWHPIPRRSGSIVIDLCVDVLRTGEFAEISATEDVIAEAFRRALSPFLLDSRLESALVTVAVLSLPQHAVDDPLQDLVRCVLDWFRGGGGGPSGPGVGPPAVPA